MSRQFRGRGRMTEGAQDLTSLLIAYKDDSFALRSGEPSLATTMVPESSSFSPYPHCKTMGQYNPSRVCSDLPAGSWIVFGWHFKSYGASSISSCRVATQKFTLGEEFFYTFKGWVTTSKPVFAGFPLRNIGAALIGPSACYRHPDAVHMPSVSFITFESIHFWVPSR